MQTTQEKEETQETSQSSLTGRKDCQNRWKNHLQGGKSASSMRNTDSDCADFLQISPRLLAEPLCSWQRIYHDKRQELHACRLLWRSSLSASVWVGLHFILVLTGSKKGSHKGRPADKGRGLFSFIFIGRNYLAWMLNPLVPGGPEPLQGVKSALIVYGSLHTALIGLCIAGVISCLIRKFFIR